MKIWSQCTIITEDKDGKEVRVAMQNLGWVENFYITQFIYEGDFYASCFSSEKATDETCPNPDQRFAYDKNYMEERLKVRFVDIEE